MHDCRGEERVTIGEGCFIMCHCASTVLTVCKLLLTNNSPCNAHKRTSSFQWKHAAIINYTSHTHTLCYFLSAVSTAAFSVWDLCILRMTLFRRQSLNASISHWLAKTQTHTESFGLWVLSEKWPTFHSALAVTHCNASIQYLRPQSYQRFMCGWINAVLPWVEGLDYMQRFLNVSGWLYTPFYLNCEFVLFLLVTNLGSVILEPFSETYTNTILGETTAHANMFYMEGNVLMACKWGTGGFCVSPFIAWTCS